jgi:hypothetical protein
LSAKKAPPFRWPHLMELARLVGAVSIAGTTVLSKTGVVARRVLPTRQNPGFQSAPPSFAKPLKTLLLSARRERDRPPSSIYASSAPRTSGHWVHQMSLCTC